MEYFYETRNNNKATNMVMVQTCDTKNSKLSPTLETTEQAFIRSRTNHLVATLMFVATMLFNVTYYAAST